MSYMNAKEVMMWDHGAKNAKQIKSLESLGRRE